MGLNTSIAVANPRLLIAEDDRALGALLRGALMSDGYQVGLVADGESAIRSLALQPFELLILDLGLPKMDGPEVLRELRVRKSDTSILVLTGTPDLDTRLSCFSLGADDCMIKPFALRELRARCTALLRRRGADQAILRFGNLEVNRMERRVRRGGIAITLTNKEYEVLEFLMLNQGRCVSRDILMEQVWKLGNVASTNVVDVYINYLRRKLNESTEDPIISTIRGHGYRIGVPSYLPA